ncbi:MAG TPA: VOC family protein [Mycobacteriales bacterium]|nr:VOC family protein [Mycobacteriales bacterium]
MTDAPVLQQINLVVTDLDETIAFCRLLGWDVEHPGFGHLEVDTGSGVTIEFDEVESVAMWNRGSAGVGSGTTVVTLSVRSRDEVDRMCAVLTEAGYACPQPPFDAFWGSRFAIITDRDGNQFGLMSPVDADRRYRPPQPPPAD